MNNPTANSGSAMWKRTERQKLVKRMRSFESDHDPDGWPAVRMRDVSALCDAVETLQQQYDALKHSRADARSVVEF